MTGVGIRNIEERAIVVNRYLTEQLTESGWKVLSPVRDERMRSAETLVALEDPARVVARLAEQKIIVTEKPQGMRVATHLFNDESDIDRLIEAL